MNGLKGVEKVQNEVNKILDGSAELPDVADIVDTEGIDSYVKEVSEIDDKVSDVALSEEGVNMSYKMPVSLFGFIPASMKTKVSVAKNKKVDVAFPWYSFLFSKPADEQSIEDNISNSIKDSVDQSSDALPVKLQAFITNSVLSTLRGLFGGK